MKINIILLIMMSLNFHNQLKFSKFKADNYEQLKSDYLKMLIY